MWLRECSRYTAVPCFNNLGKYLSNAQKFSMKKFIRAHIGEDVSADIAFFNCFLEYVTFPLEMWGEIHKYVRNLRIKQTWFSLNRTLKELREGFKNTFPGPRWHLCLEVSNINKIEDHLQKIATLKEHFGSGWRSDYASRTLTRDSKKGL